MSPPKRRARRCGRWPRTSRPPLRARGRRRLDDRARQCAVTYQASAPPSIRSLSKRPRCSGARAAASGLECTVNHIGATGAHRGDRGVLQLPAGWHVGQGSTRGTTHTLTWAGGQTYTRLNGSSRIQVRNHTPLPRIAVGSLCLGAVVCLLIYAQRVYTVKHAESIHHQSKY